VKHPWLTKIYKLLWSNKRYIAALVLFIVILVLFTSQVKTFLILAALGTAAIFTSTYKRVIRLPPVLELISLTTVLVTIFYGPLTAIIYTIIVNIGAEIASGHPDEFSLTYIPSRIIMVLGTHLFKDTFGIVGLGIFAVILFNAVQQPIFMMLVDVEKRFKALYYVALNIPLNILLFKVLGPPLFALLQAIV
jgi:hypothetical protein